MPRNTRKQLVIKAVENWEIWQREKECLALTRELHQLWRERLRRPATTPAHLL